MRNWQRYKILTITVGMLCLCQLSYASGMGNKKPLKLTDEGVVKGDISTVDCVGADITCSASAGTGTLTVASASSGGWTDNGSQVNLTTSSDNVGIGDATQAKLGIHGSSDIDQLYVKGNGTQTAKHLIHVVANDNTTRFALSGDGTATFAGNATPGMRLGSGTTATYPVTFDVSGTDTIMVGTSGNVSFSHDITVSGDNITMGTNTKGDILASDGTTMTLLPVGVTNGMVLSVDSTTSTGLRWGFAGGGAATGHKVFIPMNVQSAKLSADAYSRIDGSLTPQTMWRILFDDNAENNAGKNIAMWSGRMDDNWSGGSLTAKIMYYMVSSDSTSTAAADVTFGVSVWAMTSGDAATMSTESYDTENSKTQKVPTVLARPETITIPLTNVDSLAAGDWYMVKLRRNGADSITGDAAVISMSITE